jgi:hypothetical protein
MKRQRVTWAGDRAGLHETGEVQLRYNWCTAEVPLRYNCAPGAAMKMSSPQAPSAGVVLLARLSLQAGRRGGEEGEVARLTRQAGRQGLKAMQRQGMPQPHALTSPRPTAMTAMQCHARLQCKLLTTTGVCCCNPLPACPLSHTPFPKPPTQTRTHLKLEVMRTMFDMGPRAMAPP